ncbi:MAG TPA: SDR family oxidoreductase [Verrucomicrobiota bacterium]|jgi:NAD(P)-dependent dehydrogenase (short-subunit alcohol dehydrogenase family)|nr:SDR family oxidoreductase [Verrucomicrobiota bacterium]HRT55144.1 SDR family oxidoreductase [Candidatus Paceibacterota bacterium]
MTIKEMFDLTGKVALVTGGARDFGFHAGDVLAEAGCRVVVTARELDRAREAAEKLAVRHHRETLALALDVTRPEAVAETVGKAAAWKGHLDILVNNAGGTPSGGGAAHLFERSAEAALELISVNLMGTLYCCQAAGRVMARQGAGKIINIASIAGILGRDRRMYQRNQMRGQPVDYAAAKAGVIGMTRDLAAVLSPMGVHVNCISPGGFQRNLPPEFVKDYSDRTPLGRMGRDGIDLQGAVLYLASPASDYVTGHNLVVDGGFTIWQ